METNLIAQSMVTEIARARLPKLAERGRLVEEALAARESRSARMAVRGWLGHVLHLSSQRTFGTPRSAALGPH